MATSGSTDYNRTGTQIITFAAKQLQLIASGGALTTAEAADALEALELMIKTFQAEGVKLWLLTYARIFPVVGQKSYDLPGANACNISELSETTLDADEAAGQTVLSVTSTTQGAAFADGDVIGIELDSGSIQWTTIASSVADDTVTVDDALTGAASSGNGVWAYTNALGRPLRIESARRLNSAIDTPIVTISKQEYDDLPNKAVKAPPVQIYYDPQLATGKLYVWPTISTIADSLNITYRRSVEDFDSGANDPDFPQEWLELLGYNLAVRIAPQFGKQIPAEVAVMAQATKEAAMNWDQEEESVYFTGSGQRYG